jgi:Fic family protein
MVNIPDELQRIDEKKKKIDSFDPLPFELVQNLQEWLTINFIYEDCALTGNSLSHMETAIIVEKGIVIGGKTVREHLELVDCARAISFITQRAANRDNISYDDILTIHKVITEKNDLSCGADFMQWLHTVNDHPVIIAALAHYKLVTIHPFIDGNGRTARLLMNLLLLQHGYPLAIIQKEKRPEYIAAIEHASAHPEPVEGEKDDFDQFYKVIIDAVEYSLDIYLDAIEQSNLE